jgi:hypothetical protein
MGLQPPFSVPPFQGFKKTNTKTLPHPWTLGVAQGLLRSSLSG